MTTGIMMAIMRRCAGSMPGEGVMNCTRNMVTMMRIGRMCSGSGMERSVSQNQCAWRSSTAFSSTR